MIQKNIIGKFKDKLVGVDYVLILINAKELSDYLRKSYSSAGINIDDYNDDKNSTRSMYSSEKKEQEQIESNPPIEIYEYQNFFLLQKETEEYILLDGFRRLLWYNAPDHDVLVRIYQEKNLTSENILTLMIHLNHFKFYGGGAYLERGFSLLLKSVFHLDIFKYKEAFDAYLSSDKIKNDYGGSFGNTRNKKINTVKNRIINEFFVSDIKFIQDVNDAGYMVNTMFGAFVYNQRLSQKNKFDADKFISLLKEINLLNPLIEKYHKVGTSTSAKSIDVVNTIMDFYSKTFISMMGGEVEKTYAEKVQECKDLVTKLKKDKSLIKITGNQKYWVIDNELKNRMIIKKEKVRFVCVVFPMDGSSFDYDNKPLSEIPYGILNKEIVYLNQTTHLIKTSEHYGFINDEGIKYELSHNSHGYYGTGKKFVYISRSGMGRGRQTVELFAELSQSIFDK
jgi:hypothetical protein